MRFRAYLATSLDGFIADADGGVGWLRPYEAFDYGYDAFLAGIGALVMGRATYDQVRGLGPWPYGTRPTYVLTSRPLQEGTAPGVVAWFGDVDALLARLRGGGFDGDVWLVGGGRAIDAFRRLGAVDTWELHVIPVLLGRGIPLLLAADGQAPLRLVDHRVHANGVVGLVYTPVPLTLPPFRAPGLGRAGRGGPGSTGLA